MCQILRLGFIASSLYFAPNSPLFSTKEKWKGKIKFFRSKGSSARCRRIVGRERTDAGQSGGKPTRCGTCHWFSPVNGTVARGQVEWMCLTYFPPPPMSLASRWMSASRSRYPWLRPTAAFLHVITLILFVGADAHAPATP